MPVREDDGSEGSITDVLERRIGAYGCYLIIFPPKKQNDKQNASRCKSFWWPHGTRFYVCVWRGDTGNSLERSWPMTNLPSTTVWDGMPLTVTRSLTSGIGAALC